MQITHLEALSAVATQGSFSKAAEKLGRHQPALSKAIQALETDLGVVLLDRTPGGARLTEAGGRVLRRARNVLFGVEQLREEVAAIQGAKGGRVRIGVSPAAATAIIPNACRRFLELFPEAELDIVPTLYPEAAAQLRDGSLDLVIGPVPTKHDHDLKSEHLLDMAVTIVTHKDHRLRRATMLSELTDQRWIVHGPAEGPSSLFEAAFNDQGLGLPIGRLRCHSIAATIALLKPLNALCVLSQPVFEHHAPQGGITALPIAKTFSAFQLAVLSRKTWEPTPAQQCMADCIRLASRQVSKTLG